MVTIIFIWKMNIITTFIWMPTVSIFSFPPIHLPFNQWTRVSFLVPEIVEYGIPHLKYFGEFREYQILVLTKTGPSLLQQLLATKSRKFGLKTICKIALQAVSWFKLKIITCLALTKLTRQIPLKLFTKIKIPM